MTLGDSSAYELAKVIHSQFLSNSGDLCKKVAKPEYILPIETSKNFQDFSLEIDQILTNKKDAYYMMVQYEVEFPERGLVMKQMGFSKVLVDLLWGDNSTFLELSLNNEMNDFMTIERERYFEFIQHNIKVITAKSNQLKLNVRTFEGLSTKILPTSFRKVCYDANGNILAIMNLYEFIFEEIFVNKVSKFREKKTFITKRKSERERNLEKLLNVYYSNEDFCQKNIDKQNKAKSGDDIGSEIIIFQDSDPMKRCGFRTIHDKEIVITKKKL